MQLENDESLHNPFERTTGLGLYAEEDLIIYTKMPQSLDPNYVLKPRNPKGAAGIGFWSFDCTLRSQRAPHVSK